MADFQGTMLGMDYGYGDDIDQKMLRKLMAESARGAQADANDQGAPVNQAAYVEGHRPQIEAAGPAPPAGERGNVGAQLYRGFMSAGAAPAPAPALHTNFDIGSGTVGVDTPAWRNHITTVNRLGYVPRSSRLGAGGLIQPSAAQLARESGSRYSIAGEQGGPVPVPGEALTPESTGAPASHGPGLSTVPGAPGGSIEWDPSAGNLGQGAWVYKPGVKPPQAFSPADSEPQPSPDFNARLAGPTTEGGSADASSVIGDRPAAVGTGQAPPRYATAQELMDRQLERVGTSVMDPGFRERMRQREAAGDTAWRSVPNNPLNSRGETAEETAHRVFAVPGSMPVAPVAPQPAPSRSLPAGERDVTGAPVAQAGAQGDIGPGPAGPVGSPAIMAAAGEQAGPLPSPAPLSPPLQTPNSLRGPGPRGQVITGPAASNVFAATFPGAPAYQPGGRMGPDTKLAPPGQRTITTTGRTIADRPMSPDESRLDSFTRALDAFDAAASRSEGGRRTHYSGEQQRLHRQLLSPGNIKRTLGPMISGAQEPADLVQAEALFHRAVGTGRLQGREAKALSEMIATRRKELGVAQERSDQRSQFAQREGRLTSEAAQQREFQGTLRGDANAEARRQHALAFEKTVEEMAAYDPAYQFGGDDPLGPDGKPIKETPEQRDTRIQSVRQGIRDRIRQRMLTGAGQAGGQAPAPTAQAGEVQRAVQFLQKPRLPDAERQKAIEFLRARGYDERGNRL